LLLACFVGLYGCNHKTSTAAPPPGPSNEVLLTQEQIEKIKLTTAVVDFQEVDNTVLTSGKVTYDDQKVAHVFSPVAGKATKVFV
jgi:cobalt-zinc-cadmium efflux system membrane fusion protein